MHDKLTELETKALTLDNLILWTQIHPVLDQVNG